MSNQFNNMQKNKKEEIIGRIHVNQSSNFPGRSIQVNVKKILFLKKEINI